MWKKLGTSGSADCVFTASALLMWPICCNDTFFNFCPWEIQQIVCQVVAYGRSKTIKNVKKIISKSGCLREVVAYERWSPTRGSIYSNLTWKLSVFWKSGRLWGVVAYERWSQREVRLYIDYFLESAHVRYVRTSFLIQKRVRNYRAKHFWCCNLFILYLLKFPPFIRLNKCQVMFLFSLSAGTLSLLQNPSVNIFRNVYLVISQRYSSVWFLSFALLF